MWPCAAFSAPQSSLIETETERDRERGNIPFDLHWAAKSLHNVPRNPPSFRLGIQVRNRIVDDDKASNALRGSMTSYQVVAPERNRVYCKGRFVYVAYTRYRRDTCTCHVDG